MDGNEHYSCHKRDNINAYNDVNRTAKDLLSEEHRLCL
jgi:hypothetical protein